MGMEFRQSKGLLLLLLKYSTKAVQPTLGTGGSFSGTLSGREVRLIPRCSAD